MPLERVVAVVFVTVGRTCIIMVRRTRTRFHNWQCLNKYTEISLNIIIDMYLTISKARTKFIFGQMMQLLFIVNEKNAKQPISMTLCYPIIVNRL